MSVEYVRPNGLSRQSAKLMLAKNVFIKTPFNLHGEIHPLSHHHSRPDKVMIDMGHLKMARLM